MSDWMVSLRRWEKLIAKRIARTVGLADGAPGCGSLCVRWVSVMLDTMVRAEAIQPAVERESREPVKGCPAKRCRKHISSRRTRPRFPKQSLHTRVSVLIALDDRCAVRCDFLPRCVRA